MKNVRKQLEADAIKGQRKKEGQEVVRLNLIPRDYRLEDVAGTLRMNEDIQDFIADKFLEEILGTHG